MKANRLVALSLGAALAAGAFGSRSFAQDPPTDVTPVQDGAEAPHGWPRVFAEDGAQITMYQPQIESWEGAHLVAHAAVSIEKDGETQPTYGVLSISARTEVDKEQRTATLEDFEFTKATFPSAPGKADEWLAALRKHAPTHAHTVELDRLETSLAVNKAEASSSGPLENVPPRIFFSSTPSILVLVDGAPVRQPVAGSALQRIINTRAMLLEGEGHLYLAVGDRWLEAPGLGGPWTLAAAAPEGADAAKSAAVAADQVDLYAEDAEAVALLAEGTAPSVFASSDPAELIESQGEPSMVAVPGTRLLWAQNTDADLFTDTSSGEQYVLVSARWFRAPSRSGPWQFVAGHDLPADFARIPATCQAGEVLASIPGTPQAQEALIANDIPQTATINRSEAKLDVTYDGECKLEPIEGTSLRYAANCSTPVICDGDVYYGCEDGVWFRCGSPNGPWVCADEVPAAIYTIPPSCPLHYVTFVRIYKATPECIYTGYTSGYFGTCVSPDHCVVWGSGYRSRPWVGTRWIGRPATYGFGIGARWSAESGWSVGIGVGARPPSRPWWGPLSKPHPAFYPERHEGVTTHMNFSNANIYSHRAAVVARPPVERPRAARVVTPARPNNVYSSPDGKVFKKTTTGWEQHDGTTFRPAANPTAPAQRAQEQKLDAEQRARQLGTQRVENVRRPAAAPAPRAPAPRVEPARVQPQPRVQPTPQPRAQAPQRAPTRAPAPVAPGLRGGTIRKTR